MEVKGGVPIRVLPCKKSGAARADMGQIIIPAYRLGGQASGMTSQLGAQAKGEHGGDGLEAKARKGGGVYGHVRRGYEVHPRTKGLMSPRNIDLGEGSTPLLMPQ